MLQCAVVCSSERQCVSECVSAVRLARHSFFVHSNSLVNHVFLQSNRKSFVSTVSTVQFAYYALHCQHQGALLCVLQCVIVGGSAL